MESITNSKIFTKDTIVKLLTSIRETKKVIEEIKFTKERILVKKDILLKTLEKTKNAEQNVEQEYSDYKEFISYVIDISYYIKKHKYSSTDINISEIHNSFGIYENKFNDPKICVSTIKTQPNIAFITNIQKANSYKNRLDYLIKINTTELNIYNNKLHTKKLEHLYAQLTKINTEIESEKTERYEIYKQIINEIIDGNIIRSVPFYNIKNKTIQTNILSDIECTKLQIRLNCSKQIELKKRIVEYTNVIENDIYNVYETLFNTILKEVSEYFSTEKYNILITSLDKKNNTLTSKLINIDKRLTDLSKEFNLLFNQMADILQRINISQIHIWNLAVNEFNLNNTINLNT